MGAINAKNRPAAAPRGRAAAARLGARLRGAGTARATANRASTMLAHVAAFVTTALALTLIALAHGLRPRPRGWALIAGVALAAGPATVAVLGFVEWLLVVAVATVALTAYATARHDERAKLRA